MSTRVVDPTDVLWRRIGAFLVDVVVVVAVTVVALVVAPAAVAGLVALAVLVGNDVVLQGTTGGTVGKHLVGLRCVDAEGRACGPGKAALRWVLWIVDAFPYLLPAVGFITCFSSVGHQRVGDRLAGTWVVDRQYVGSPPFAIAIPADPDRAPYRLSTMTAYQTGPIASPTPAPGTVEPDDLESSPAKRGDEPVWDEDRQAYVRWDARHNRWLAFDEAARTWRPSDS